MGRRLRWRLWMLLIALGLVIFVMRELNRPTTAERLGLLFGGQEQATNMLAEDAVGEDAIVLGGASAPSPSPMPDEVPTVPQPTNNPTTEEAKLDPLANVQDNTYLRPSETEAWFGLFERLQRLDEQELNAESIGELTYAQLLKQPKLYRGKVVEIRGTLRREEVVRPAKNELGIKEYHRLIIQPRGGGNWPFVAYCLTLPEGLPRGDNLQTSISVTGFFFKNWSYAWRDGLGIAPLVLARSVEWSGPRSASRSELETSGSLLPMVAAACVFAGLVVFIVFRNTRRPRRSLAHADSIVLPDAGAAAETVDEQLQRLTDAENA